MPKLTFRDKPLYLYRGVDNKPKWKLYQDDQTRPEPLPAEAIVRFKLAEDWGDDPELDIDSVGPSANGSRLTIVSYDAPANGTMLITRAEMEEICVGKYVGLLGWVDPNDDDRWKLIECGTVIVRDTIGGEVGTT